MVQITEPRIEKVGKKYVAFFDMWDDARDIDLKMQMEYGADSKERLLEKIDHLKKTGIILRD